MHSCISVYLSLSLYIYIYIYIFPQPTRPCEERRPGQWGSARQHSILLRSILNPHNFLIGKRIDVSYSSSLLAIEDTDFTRKSQLLHQLYIRGRHYMISTITSTQVYKQISPSRPPPAGLCPCSLCLHSLYRSVCHTSTTIIIVIIVIIIVIIIFIIVIIIIVVIVVNFISVSLLRSVIFRPSLWSRSYS